MSGSPTPRPRMSDTSSDGSGPRGNSQVDYRPARECDIDSIAALHARSWRENYRDDFTSEYLDGDLVGERRAVWTERLCRPPPNQRVQLALRGNDLVGFVCVYAAHDPTWGSFVDNLHVVRESKGMGIGAQLMRQAGEWLARAHDSSGVFLWVLASNVAGRRFYERIGAENSEIVTMETHGAAMVRSCRYTWAAPSRIAVGRDSGRRSEDDA